MNTIAELCGRHLGEEAWIFGKGPSLDRFDMALAKPLRICINESVRCVMDPTYFFAHDEPPIERAALAWPRGCRAVLEPARAKLALARGIAPEAVFSYRKRCGELDVLHWSPEKIAQEASLVGLTGTVHSALHFCRLIGASSVVLVAMDGSGGYAKCIGLAPPVGGGQHDRIRRDTINVAKLLGLDLRFFPAQ